MAKRFIDSSMFDKDWFLDLPSKYKILWIYIISKCDVAGVFDPSLKQASRTLGEVYDYDETLSAMQKQIEEINGKWFVKDFIRFQYGSHVSPKMVKPINDSLSNVNLSIQEYASKQRNYTVYETTDTPKDKDKDKDIDKEKDKDKDKDTAIDIEQTLLREWGGHDGRQPYPVLCQFADLKDKHGWNKVLFAIQVAAKQNKKSLAYVNGILDNRGKPPPKKRQPFSVDNPPPFLNG